MSGTPSSPFDPADFAREWITAWNAGDIERVLSHFEPDAEFRSPRAAEITGNAIVHGHEAMRAYWTAALEHVSHHRFTLDSVVWDGTRQLVLVYESEVGDRHRRACEFYDIDPNTHLARGGEAMYGAELP